MKFGGMEQTKESVRERRGVPVIETLLQDLRFAARMLRKNLGFTAVAVLVMALGIGASTAILSVVYGVLLRPLPYPKPDPIVQLWEVDAKGTRMNFTEPNFFDVRNGSQTLEGLAECNAGAFPITGGVEPTRTAVAPRPTRGRGPSPTQIRQNRPVLLNPAPKLP